MGKNTQKLVERMKLDTTLIEKSLRLLGYDHAEVSLFFHCLMEPALTKQEFTKLTQAYNQRFFEKVYLSVKDNKEALKKWAAFFIVLAFFRSAYSGREERFHAVDPEAPKQGGTKKFAVTDSGEWTPAHISKATANHRQLLEKKYPFELPSGLRERYVSAGDSFSAPFFQKMVDLMKRWLVPQEIALYIHRAIHDENFQPLIDDIKKRVSPFWVKTEKAVDDLVRKLAQVRADASGDSVSFTVPYRRASETVTPAYQFNNQAEKALCRRRLTEIIDRDGVGSQEKFIRSLKFCIAEVGEYLTQHKKYDAEKTGDFLRAAIYPRLSDTLFQGMLQEVSQDENVKKDLSLLQSAVCGGKKLNVGGQMLGDPIPYIANDPKLQLEEAKIIHKRLRKYLSQILPDHSDKLIVFLRCWFQASREEQFGLIQNGSLAAVIEAQRKSLDQVGRAGKVIVPIVALLVLTAILGGIGGAFAATVAGSTIASKVVADTVFAAGGVALGAEVLANAVFSTSLAAGLTATAAAAFGVARNKSEALKPDLTSAVAAVHALGLHNGSISANEASIKNLLKLVYPDLSDPMIQQQVDELSREEKEAMIAILNEQHSLQQAREKLISTYKEVLAHDQSMSPAELEKEQILQRQREKLRETYRAGLLAFAMEELSKDTSCVVSQSSAAPKKVDMPVPRVASLLTQFSGISSAYGVTQEISSETNSQDNACRM